NGAFVPPRLSSEFLQTLGIDPGGRVPITRPLLPYVQHMFLQIEEKQDDLRMYSDRDPRVQFYNPQSHSSEGLLEFDLSGAPIDGNVTKIEVAFTGHTHRQISLQITSPYRPGIRVSTFHTEQGHLADVTNLAMDQVLNTTLNLFVSVSKSNHQVRHLNPVLAVFLDINVSLLHTVRRKRFVPSNRNSTMETAETLNPCRLEEWTVDFRDLGWYEKFILRPITYQANICAGDCPVAPMDPYFNATNHVLIKYLLEKRLCCSPIEYMSQTLMFIKNNITAIQTVRGMSVSRCGCR
ncbi:protein decapentaplegic-like, partial [Saccostrea cucullata]|uniref:protein decapentaplegic-like n=1 Tax=Saccostrea cuccullata TaxID=36930 RepID=UPI002ED5C014